MNICSGKAAEVDELGIGKEDVVSLKLLLLARVEWLTIAQVETYLFSVNG